MQQLRWLLATNHFALYILHFAELVANNEAKPPRLNFILFIFGRSFKLKTSSNIEKRGTTKLISSRCI